MSENKESSMVKLIFYNAFRFVINMGCVLGFQYFFGSENILTGVAIAVGFTMLPLSDLPIRPTAMVVIIVVLYTGGGLMGQLALISPWIAFPFNFAFTAFILLLSTEPSAYKTNITFLLCFVFSQATPVPWDHVMSRFYAAFLGSLFVACSVWIHWKRHGYGKDGRTLRQQIELCSHNRSYLFRMSFGIAFAMAVGMVLQLKKPLWISIVVMSLTQLEFSETMERIKHRFIGTLVGVALFFLLFEYLMPQDYGFYFVMFLGYLGFFLPDYKYKQVINAISALYASLVLLDTKTAIEGRLICLFGGIVIVLVIYALTFVVKRIKQIENEVRLRVLADDFPQS